MKPILKAAIRKMSPARLLRLRRVLQLTADAPAVLVLPNNGGLHNRV